MVTYEWEGKDYYVDPTLSDQGGFLDDLYFPDYGVGLIIKEGVNKLIEIPKSKSPYTRISEMITINDFSGNAEFIVRSEMYGRKSDEIRSLFANKTKDEITRDYTNIMPTYTQEYHPQLWSLWIILHEVTATVEEYYQIPNF